jgi:hypothetical protein
VVTTTSARAKEAQLTTIASHVVRISIVENRLLLIARLDAAQNIWTKAVHRFSLVAKSIAMRHLMFWTQTVLLLTC